MDSFGTITDPQEREALLALWSLPGMGVAHLCRLREAVGGSLGALLDSPLDAWVGLVPVALAEKLRRVRSLRARASDVRERAAHGRIGIAFVGEDAYPRGLTDLKDAPPVIFHRGCVGAERRRAALVGTRKIDTLTGSRAFRFALEVASAGVGVVSGAAYGIDQRCHRGALVARQETWAFLGCGLDELDDLQAELAAEILDGRGRILSEYPPGVRSEKQHFPRRNRLIAAASDVTVVLRAPAQSGALHTAGFAHSLGRPVLALPDDVAVPEAAGCLTLIHRGYARLCTGPADVLAALGIVPSRTLAQGDVGRSLEGLGISGAGRSVYRALKNEPRLLEQVLGDTGLDAAEACAALCELELHGLAVQHPGRLYEKV
jgi:DNA processing protein